MAIGPIQLIRQATPGQRRTLLAAAMGWALDAFDAMLYSLALAMLMRDLGMSKTVAGSLGTLTLLASGIGGVSFGLLADRMGRKHALIRRRRGGGWNNCLLIADRRSFDGLNHY